MSLQPVILPCAEIGVRTTDLLEFVSWEGEGWSEDIDIEDFAWHCVRYPVDRLLQLRMRRERRPWSRTSWQKWLQSEIELRSEDFLNDDYYEDLARIWTTDPVSIGPVIIAEWPKQRRFDIGDGWHRTAIAISKRMHEIPAVLGTL